MSIRKRRPNWTDQECLLLAQLTQERKDRIRGKSSTGVTVQDKRLAWDEITQAINNAFPEMERTTSDCNKKWENLLAKAKDEIKRRKTHAGTDGLSCEKLTAVTQVVISVMNLPAMLQQDNEDSVLVDTEQNSCIDAGHECEMDASLTNTKPLTELRLPLHPDPSTSPAAEQIRTAFSHVPKSLAVQFSSPRPADFTVLMEHDSPCSSPSVRCPRAQERMDLEMCVLRRQDAVLKLQEEYYTLKIQLMKKQMEGQLQKD